VEPNEKSIGVTAPVSEASTQSKDAAETPKSPKRVSDKARIKTATQVAAKTVQSSKARIKKKTAAHESGLRKARIERMMSKAELARRANLSVLTIDRVERGLGCRMDTKRKILEALGLSLADRVSVFGEEE
jgi:ribosome-binding protein aMBF1 (putative translation factor)